MSKVQDFYPLTPMQEGMLFHSLMDPGAGVYVKQTTHALKGELNVSALESAWKELVARHPILRTYFILEDLKKPVQVVKPNVRAEIYQEDWSGLPDEDQDQRLRDFLQADISNGFDLSQPPLMRLSLIKLADDKHRLVWTWHHILMDGWSEGLLIKELFQWYKAGCQNRKLRLPRLRPFREYLYWLQQQDLSTAEAFWRRTLKGFTKPISLARTLSAKDEVQRSPAFEKKGVLLSKDATAALQSFTRQHHFTLNTLLQAAWGLILSRYSGQQDVLFGVVVSGRPAELAGVDSMIGLFVNTLPVRIQVNPQSGLLLWLSDLQTRQAEALRFDYSPLSEIQKWSEGPRGVPLIESILAFEMSSLSTAVPTRMEQNVGLRIEDTHGTLQISNPLSILIQPGRQLLLGISYDGRRFAGELIERLLADFQYLLEKFVAQPEQKLSAFLSEIGPDLSEPIPVKDELTELLNRSNLTRNQLIVWLGQKMNPDAPLYNNPFILKLSGPLVPEHFQRAFRAIVDSSDAMRTIFEEVDGIPQQRVLTHLEWNMDYLDFSRSPDPEAMLESWLQDRCATTMFDLGKCLFDGTLIKVADRKFAAYFNAHHLIFDGWSVSILLHQLLPVYESFAKGKTEGKLELKQFSDYVAHEREFRRSSRYQEAAAFWQQKLADGLEPLAFYGKPTVKKTFKVEKLSFDLGSERTSKLKEKAVSPDTFLLSQEFTTFSIFASLASAFLYRVTSTRRISLGVYFHNRHGFRDTIGLLMHVHPLRITVEEGDTFQSLIKKTRSEYLKILKHRDYPIANASRNPVYDVLINYVNASYPTQMDGIAASYKWLQRGYGSESLNIEFNDYESSGNFGVGFSFHQDVFTDRQRAEAVQHFLQITDSYLNDSSRPIALAKLLSDEEMERLLRKFNDTRWDYDQELTILAQFEKRVEETPDKIAVVANWQALTYTELNSRANQLAHHLIRHGAGPETLIGLCLDRSLELIIGTLGILKAGAAFVPCDPSYPKDRVEFMLGDSAAPVLLTQQNLLKDLPHDSATVICLDTGWEVISAESSDSPQTGLTPDNIAYVIYTSGSTGKPKGTMIQHGSLADYNQTASLEYEVTADDRVLQFCSLGFDISIEEIVPCLTQGATLVFRNDEMLESIPTFLQTCEEWEVTMMSLPTAFWHEMTEGINTFGLSIYDALRLVIIAGEKVLPEKLVKWQRHVGQAAQLINTYGLTESTIISTAIDLTILTLNGGESKEVPIGCPIRNTQLYVSDENMEPVPGSMPGELHVGGNLLARGYHRRPDVTAARFIPDPFSTRPGARLYKTGDLARFLSDTSLEFLGRGDRQVKIRGFRVELEEVAAALRQHPAVRDGVVILREESSGQKQLVAYVVPRQQPSEAGDNLRAFFTQTLPDYMVPAAFVMIESLPMSPNGKVDYRALPAPDRSHMSLEKSYVAPRTKLETDLSEIWASVLGVDRVGIHDNYFDLGGDSIRSIQIRAKAQQRGITFTIQNLFQYQTIEELAHVCEVHAAGTITIAQTEPFSLVSQEDRENLPAGLEDAYPLARLQAGMLFHNLYHLNSDLYMDVSMAHLQLPYNADALQAAIRELTARHPILRTSFDLSNYSEPLQLVWPKVPILFSTEDISGMSAEAQERYLRDWLDKENRTQFDLTKAPLMRYHVHQRGDGTIQFTWSNHHAILDGWSMAVMLGELFRLYKAELSGERGRLEPAPTVAYREFIALEREVLNSDDARQYVSNIVRDLTVTTIPRRTTSASRKGIPDTQSLSLVPPLELCEELKRLSTTFSIPLKSFVLAAKLRILSLVSGQSDVTTGMVMSGRPELQDGDRVLGLFTNTIPIRSTLSGGTWIELVRKVFDIETGIIPYRRFPISELKTMEGGEILFETMFNFTHFYLYKTVPRISGARIFDVKVRGASNYVFVTDCNQDISSSQFELAFSYDASLVDRDQVEAISKCYLRALEAMVQNPNSRYESLSALSPEEWNRVLVQWNTTAVDYTPETPIQYLFEEQAEKHPDASALIYNGEQLTYAELNRKANQLARRLKGFGVGPEVLVGLCVERSLEMVIGLLAVLKAGGAYVPLDPGYPKNRLGFMLNDSAVSLLLTQNHLLDRLPDTQAQLLCIDRYSDDAPAPSSENPAHEVGPDNLVYMIYTSGSTGQPKGALNTHRGLHNRLKWMQEQYQLSPNDRVLQKTPFSFDVSVWEFFWPLITGAGLVMARPGGHQESNYLIGLINQAQITVLHFVPSMLQAFLAEPEVESCSSLRQVVCSGEALSYEAQERFSERSQACLDNLYGPTEASIDVTFWSCREDESRSVPIGRPIANTEIYLLDPSLQPVPVGSSGELYIGGVGLARGYHRRPELTSEKFVPHPFSRGRSGVLYKTGDLARYRSDGNIEYLGRIDHQVKIRGFRIELGEVESALREFDNVKDLIVQAVDDASGGQRLVAYVAYDHEPPPTNEEMRDFLKQKLPDYMVPSAFALMPNFPLTHNGKINRRALAEMTPGTLSSERTFVAPRDTVELRLISIWEEVFRIHPIGVEDNFFELGGHSILAVKLMARIHKEFGEPLPLSILSEGGTIAHLANVLRTQPEVNMVTTIVPIQPKGTRPPLFFVHPLGGHVLRFYDLARKLGQDQPFFGIQGKDLTDLGEDNSSMEEIARGYVEAMREVQPTGPYYLGGFSFGSFVAFEMAQQLISCGEEVAFLTLLDTWAPRIVRMIPEFETNASLLSIIAKEMSLRAGLKDFDLPVEKLEEFEGEAQMSYFLDELKKNRLLDERVTVEMAMPYVDNLMTGIRSRGSAVRTYETQIYPGKITFVRCLEQEAQLISAFVQGGADVDDPTSGWSSLSTRPVEVHLVSGYHERMMNEPTVSEVAKIIDECIGKTLAGGESMAAAV